MPLSSNVGLSRKASKDFQSSGVSINVTAELDQSLLARPGELQQQIGDLYSQAEQALDRQAGLNEHQHTQHAHDDHHEPQQRPYGPRNNEGATGRGNATDGSNGPYRPGNGGSVVGIRKSNNGHMTDSQRKAIYAIGKRLGVDGAAEISSHFGWELQELTVKQASQAIDHLKALQQQAADNAR